MGAFKIARIPLTRARKTKDFRKDFTRRKDHLGHFFTFTRLVLRTRNYREVGSEGKPISEDSGGGVAKRFWVGKANFRLTRTGERVARIREGIGMGLAVKVVIFIISPVRKIVRTFQVREKIGVGGVFKLFCARAKAFFCREIEVSDSEIASTKRGEVLRANFRAGIPLFRDLGP